MQRRLMKAVLLGLMLMVSYVSYVPTAEAAFWNDVFVLTPNQSRVVDANGVSFDDVILLMQGDGNLVLYKRRSDLAMDLGVLVPASV